MLRSASFGPIPEDLLALLGESNGIKTPDGTDLVWSVSQLLSRNQSFRDSGQIDATLYRPFAPLLLLGEAGNSDLYAYDLAARRSRKPAIIIQWDHETDERSVFAKDLKNYLESRGAAEVGAAHTAPRDSPSEIVSVWVGGHRSKSGFDAYVAAGGSGRVSADGLPQSCFEAEWGLSLKDLLNKEQQGLRSPQPTSVARLLKGAPGAHSFAVAAGRKAAAAGRARARSAILVYGLNYKAPGPIRSREVVFAGCFRFE